MAHAAQPMRQINLKVSEKVYAKLEKLAKDADTPVSTTAGFLFDAAYAARVKGTPDADLDAHVAVVGLATEGGASREQLATATGLTPEVIQRMQDAWIRVLRERRRGQ
ncbi:hypothetical protein [Aureimonas sp. SK2]|uniref:hypothetical protein n=1 Tax=Aureimonas sp. SK2 TaxID=3015992 RepID=UPI00244533CC|nr:hypothetical protein [Aureimonas sp. SK2]